MIVKFTGFLSVVLTLCWGALAHADDHEAGDVLLGVGDVLKLKVFNQAGLSDTYEVLPDGSIAVPGLGRIENVTRLSDAKAGIARLMDENFGLEDTFFSVTIDTLRPITISGDVERPGEVSYKLGLRVAQAIALAGGPTKDRLDDNLGRFIQVNQETERLKLSKLRLARALITEARLLAESNDQTTFEIPAEALELVSFEEAEALRENELEVASTNAAGNDLAESRLEAASQINEKDIAAQRTSRASLETQLDLLRADLERIAPLIQSQGITAGRVLSLRRDVAQIEGLLGQAVANLAQAETEQAVLAEEDLALEIQRSLTIVSQLIATQSQIMDAKASIAEVQGTLDSLGDLPFLRQSREPTPADCRISILRSAADGSPVVEEADAFTIVKPGDHVEVGPITRACRSMFF